MKALGPCILTAVLAAAAARLLAAPADAEGVLLPGGARLVEIDFERHVTSLFGRLGCNAGSCHGSFQGRGGFRLSLFGQSPAMDYDALIGDRETARVVVGSPDESLILRKPSGLEDHEGGVRMDADSWEFQVLRRWIAAGARHTPGRGAVAQLRMEPAEPDALALGQTRRLRVTARFANGEQEDVTALCEFRSRDESICRVTSQGELTAAAAGATAVVVGYRGAFATVPILIPYVRQAAVANPPAAHNFIDREINAQLARLRLTASPPADDAEFLRRLTLDALATLPKPQEILAFLADPDPAKRAKAIEAALAHPRRAAWWATRMCDITGCNLDTMEPPVEMRAKRAKMWHDWLRHRFERNVSYDKIVEGILCATSRDAQPIDAWIDAEAALEAQAASGFESRYGYRPALDLFWRRMGRQGPVPIEDMAELTAAAFLGIRLHCARCHQHPFDRWTQRDFARYAEIFTRAQFGSSSELRSAMLDRLESRRQARQQGQQVELPPLPRLQEVFLSAVRRPLADAELDGTHAAQAPGGPEIDTAVGASDPRRALLHWLLRPDNPYFARNFVNRVWAKYFGRGLVEPVDAFSATNPATHPRLLDALAAAFIANGYDIAAIERLILSSAAYQRSWRPLGNNGVDGLNLARATVRPLMAEVVLDALNAALEAHDDFGADVPPGSQAIEIAPNRLADASSEQLLRMLGRGDRKSLCECDRSTTPTLRLPLFLMSDERVLAKIRAGRLDRLLRSGRSNAEMIDEFYLATLSRPPDEDERRFALDHVEAATDRREALIDLVWALVNTREFITNH